MRPLPGLLLAALAAACAAGPREDTVLLLHTNDVHGHIERMPTLAGLVKAEREKRRDVLFLDAGDAVSGTPVSTVFRGTPVYSVGNLAGYDAACLGNHEFDHGFARIAAFRETAAYPLLCANAWAPAPPPGPNGKGEDRGPLLGDAPWTVLDCDGVRVGIIGLVTEKTPGMTVRKGNEGVVFEPAAAALRRLVPEVRPKCDLLVALTHLGYEEDVELARTVPGVDVIVGGHSHTDLPGPVQIGDTVIVQAFCYGQRLGRLELTVDLEKRRVLKWEGRPIPVDPASQPRDPLVAAAVEEFEKQVARTVDVAIGTARADLSRQELKSITERAYRETLGCDFGLQNDGGVRDVIPKGPVTIRQIWTVLPFDNTLVKVRIRGARLPEAWKRQRRDVDPERIYTVATNSFVADHLEKHLPGCEPGVEDSGIALRDAVVAWVRKNPDLR
jgi:2',3'-cyclic-nucleotide 2'-phosphodiesterase (5'-nucleotidase family)